MGAFDRLKEGEKRGSLDTKKRTFGFESERFCVVRGEKILLHRVFGGMWRLGEHEFFDLFDLSAEGFVGIEQIGNRFARVQHRRMVASSDRRTDCRKRRFRMLLGQIHGDLTGLGDFAGAFRRVESVEI